MKYKIPEITVAAIFRGYCEHSSKRHGRGRLYSLRHPLSHTDPGPAIKTLRGANVKTFRLFKLPFLLCVLLGSLLLVSRLQGAVGNRSRLFRRPEYGAV